MRIFVTSDLHGNRKLIDKAVRMTNEVDLVIICGDIGTKNVSRRDGGMAGISKKQKEDAKYFLDKVNRHDNIRFILGNDDWFDINTASDEGRNYLSGPEVINGQAFIPFEYVAITPFNTNRERNENSLELELSKLGNIEGAIIVAHNPPLGYGDTLYNGIPCGSRAILNAIQEGNPKMWLCGHIHEDFSQNRVDNDAGTVVLNCACRHETDKFRGFIVDTNGMKIERVVVDMDESRLRNY